MAKKIALFTTALFFLGIGFVSAQNVRVNDMVEVPITTINSTLKVFPGSEGDEIITDGTSLAITKGATGIAVTVVSSDQILLTNDKGLPTICESGVSKLVITIEAKVTITPTTNAQHCSGSSVGGGSGGGGGGGSSATTTTTTTTTTSKTTTTTPGKEGTVGEKTTSGISKEEMVFVDINKMPTKDKRVVLQVTKVMADGKTYKYPRNKKYGPTAVTKGSFAVQIWNALAEVGCGSTTKFPGIKSCIKVSKEVELIDDKFNEKKNITRVDFYDGLLRARRLTFVEAKAEDLSKACKDVKKPTDYMAQVYFTAKKYKLPSRYKGGKCQLTKAFSRLEAARFTSRALAIEQ